jgi:ferredoxin, 2Fe-2S
MPKITFIRPDGSQQVLTGTPGQSVMQLATAHGIPEIEADCGGACACATCHVIVDASWADRLPPQGTMEADMIEFAADVTPTSRLSCQLNITEAFDGLILHLPVRQV